MQRYKNWEKQLQANREGHYNAKVRKTKLKYITRDEELRNKLAKELKAIGFDNANADKIAQWNPYDQNGIANWFDPEYMFGVNSGFDIVIGNPPYVRVEKQSTEMRQKIKNSNQYKTLYEKWDIYIPFIEKGYGLLKCGGVTTMIVSDAYCHAKYAMNSQKWFLQNSRILQIDFFSKIKIFDANVRNVTYMFQKADGSSYAPKRYVHNPSVGIKTCLSTNKQRDLTYRMFFPEDTHIKKVLSPTVFLSDICYISYGLRPSNKKGATEKFITSDLVSEKEDILHCRPFVEGKHLDCWLPIKNLWIEWGSKRSPAKFYAATFPEMYEVDEKILIQRSPGPNPKACYDNNHLVFTTSSVGLILWSSLSGIRNKSIKKQARYVGENPRSIDLPKREELEKISQSFAVKFLLGVINSTVVRDFLKANRRSNIHLYPNDWKKIAYS